ncbi:hypothetical protein A9Q99_03015 [Gammaproteobacteria bacterium 45_16_T64]|nr:hypothetical protein A9Q99_03015 [Gammaproteobacteria bacterium 45_16_T64]
MRCDHVLLISSSYVLHANAHLTQFGINCDEHMQTHGINKQQLLQSSSFLPLQQVRAYFRAIKELTPLPELGLVLGQGYNITSHGLAGIAAISQKNLYECLRVCSQLMTFRIPALHADLILSDSHFGLRFEEVIPLGKDFPMMIEIVCLAVLRIIDLLFPLGHKKSHLNLSYSKPDYHQLYTKNYSISTTFNSQFCEILLPLSEKNCALTQYDPVNSKTLLTDFLNEIPDVNRDNLFKRVKLLLESPEGFLADQQMISTLLAVSPRTLRRKFKEADCTFQELINIIKNKKATDYLINTDTSIADISALLEFNDSSHFTKAFKSWKGMSPSTFRAISRTQSEKFEIFSA